MEERWLPGPCLLAALCPPVSPGRGKGKVSRGKGDDSEEDNGDDNDDDSDDDSDDGRPVLGSSSLSLGESESDLGSLEGVREPSDGGRGVRGGCRAL